MSLRPVIGLLAALAVLAACSSGSDGSTDGAAEEASGQEDPDEESGEATTSTSEVAIPPIIIGAVMAESGLMAPIDSPAVAAAAETIATINSAGGLLGRPLELRVVDTESQFNGGFQAAQSLINDDAALLLVTCDYDFALPAIQAGDEAGTLMISPCSGDARWGGAPPSPLAFSMATLSEAEGEVLGSYALDSGARIAAVLTDLSSPETIGQCAGFRRAFEQGGGQVSFDLDFDFRLLDTFDDQIPENEPDLALLGFVDVIALCTSPPEPGPAVIRLLRGLGYRAPILSGSTMGGETWIVDVPDLGDFWAVTYALTGGGDPSPAVDELFSQLAAIDRGYVTDGRPVTGADAVAMFADAVIATGSLEGAELAQAIKALPDQPVVSGSLGFAADSHISSGRSLRIVREEGGRLVYLESRPAR